MLAECQQCTQARDAAHRRAEELIARSRLSGVEFRLHHTDGGDRTPESFSQPQCLSGQVRDDRGQSRDHSVMRAPSQSVSHGQGLAQAGKILRQVGDPRLLGAEMVCRSRRSNWSHIM